jgi:hypothetical protein
MNLSFEDLPDFDNYERGIQSNITVEFLKYHDIILGDTDEVKEFFASENNIDLKITVLFIHIFTTYPSDLRDSDYQSIFNDFHEFFDFKNYNDLREEYQQWIVRYIDDLDMQEKQFDRLKEDFGDYEAKENDFELVNEESIRFESIISVDFKTFQAFFDAFHVSELFPVVWFPGANLLKVYAGKKQNLSWTKQNIYDNILYIRYRFGLIQVSLEEKFRIELTLENSKNRQQMLLDLTQFPFEIEELSGNQKFITYRYYLPQFDLINIDALLAAIMLDGSLSTYLHIIEPTISTSITSIHLLYKFPFESLNPRNFSFYLRGNNAGERKRTSRSLKSINEQQKNAYVDIRFKGSDQDIGYVKIIGYLIRKYLTEQAYISELIRIYVGSETERFLSGSYAPSSAGSYSETSSVASSASILSSVSLSARPSGYISRNQSVKLENFFETEGAPTTFSNTPIFSKCQVKQQPRILKPETIEEWKKLTFDVNGKSYNRIALPYPAVNPRYYLGCPTDAYPFVGVNAGQSGEAFPCCFTEDQMVGEKKKLPLYLAGSAVRVIRGVSGTASAGSKILSPNKAGALPTTLKKLFQIFDNEEEYYKSGVYENNNSFLQSVLLSYDADFGRYFRSNNVNYDEIVRRIRDFRLYLSELDETKLNVLRETNPGKTVPEIRERLRNDEIYFDPRLFAPLIELIVDQTIFIFEIRDQKISYVHTNNAFFPGKKIVEPKDLGLIIIGQKTDRSDFIQWEISYHRPKERPFNDKSYYYEYNEGFTKKLANFINNQYKSYEVRFTPNDLYLYSNVWFNVEKLLRLNPIGQRIDTLGKTRWLIFTNFALMIPPITPLQLPVIDTDIENYPITAEIIQQLRKTFIGAQELSYIQDDGSLWSISWNYPDNTVSSFRIFFLPTTTLPVVNAKNIRQISMETMRQQDTVPYNRKTSTRLERLITFLAVKFYISEGYTIISKLNLNLFAEQFEFNEVVYDFQYLRGVYPKGEYREILNQLVKSKLSTITGVIILPNKEIQQRLFSYLKRWFANRERTPLAELEYDLIDNFYDNIGDFEQSRMEKVYFGIDAYEAEHKNLQRLIITPKLEILYPCGSNMHEAIGRTVSWRTTKINSDIRTDYRPFETTVAGLKSVQNFNQKLYIIKEHIKQRGGSRNDYQAILPLKGLEVE